MPDGGAYLAMVLASRLEPPPELTVSSWADQHRVLSRKSSAEYGQWRTSRMPFLREIQDCLSVEHPSNEVVMEKATQIGGTEIGLNFVGYTIDYDPQPIMLVWPTSTVCKRNSRTRIAPMISECPTLRAKVSPDRSRDSSNTAVMKEFVGGVLIIAGANSANDLASQPCGKLMLDEIDKYPKDLDDEGDAVDQAEARTSTFWRHKIFKTSSPTVLSLTRIHKEFKRSDMRYYHVPCPHCGEFQRLVWGNLQWPEGNPRAAVYVCAACANPIEERYKDDMLAAGTWVATVPGWTLVDGVWRLPAGGVPVPGFHISGLYTPLGLGRTWGQHAERYVARKDDPTRLKSWTHQTLGEPFDDTHELVDWEELQTRAEPYQLREIPPGCFLLTASVDVQKDRLEILVRGFGGERRWTIDHHYLPGDPLRDEVWAQLDDYLARPFVNHYGVVMRLSAVAVDAGYLQHDVVQYCRHRKSRGVHATKGMGGLGRVTLSKPTRVDWKRNGVVHRAGGELHVVGVDTIKQWLVARLAADNQHGPTERLERFSQGLGPDFYRQLTSESFDPDKRRYVLQDGRRNEALDCTVYAEAIAHHPTIGIQRMRAPQWQQLARMYEPIQGDLLTPATPVEDAQNSPVMTTASAPPAAVPQAEPGRAAQTSAPDWLGDTEGWLDR